MRVQMEANNDVPADIERRRVLAELLNIPTYLFGLAALGEVSIQPETHPPSTAKVGFLDLTEYKDYLSYSWAQHYSTTADPLVSRLRARIGNLASFADDAQGDQATQAKELLCVYHYLVIDISRDQQSYPAAFNHINNVVELAQDMDRDDILATAMLRSGLTNFEKSQFGAASFNIHQALALVEHTPPQLRGYILQTAGLLLSRTARTDQERTFALESKAWKRDVSCARSLPLAVDNCARSISLFPQASRS